MKVLGLKIKFEIEMGKALILSVQKANLRSQNLKYLALLEWGR